MWWLIGQKVIIVSGIEDSNNFSMCFTDSTLGNTNLGIGNFRQCGFNIYDLFARKEDSVGLIDFFFFIHVGLIDFSVRFKQ